MVQELIPAGSDKLIVGLTGGFGSGKSAVSAIFETLGACVIDADALAHEALSAESETGEKIRALFPEISVQRGKGVDRAKLAEAVFRNPEKRKQLEEIVHPYVFQRIKAMIGEAEGDIIVLEVPLLFETGFERYCHQAVVVDTAPDKIRERLQAKGFSPRQIEARQKAQWPMEEKKKKGQIIIHNSGTPEETRRIAEAAWEKLRAAHQRRTRRS